MKKMILAAAVLLFAFSAHAADVKIGYVDISRAFYESERGLEAKKNFDEIVKAKQSSIDKMQDELEKIQAELDKQASILNPETKKEKEEQRDKLRRELQRVVQDSQEELKKKEAELSQGILKELRELIGKVGKEEGYTVIFEANESGLLYIPKELDITQKVIKKYDETAKPAGTKK